MQIAKANRIAVIVSILATAAIAAGLATVLPAHSQSENAFPKNAPEAVADTVGETIGYQGLLTDDGGERLSGSYTMVFRLYHASSGGAPVYESGEMTVNAEDGLFNVGLDVPQSVFDGEALWLAIEVEGEVLSPREQIRPAPYAMSLRPGALIRNAATGTAVRIESQDVALYGAGDNFGVYGVAEAGQNGYGYGGYFTSTTGVGAFGGSTATPSISNTHVPGVYGYSERGAGVYGTSDGFFGYGVFGEMRGAGIGAYGRAATGYGALGVSDGAGVYGSGQSHGVYGTNTGPVEGSGYGGYFESSTGVGVYGSTTAVPTLTNNMPAGVYGYSEHGAGVYGEGGSTFAWGGYFSGHVRIDGSLVVSDSLFANDKGGYLMDIAFNGDEDPLERGDLIVVTGVADAVSGDLPVPIVRRAETEASTAVIGVVDRRYQMNDDGPNSMADEPIPPGDYLGIATVGAFPALKVDASYGAIRPGDLLVASPTPGHAMRADDPGVGTVIGKALDSLDEGTGAVAVMITLQ